MSLGHCVLLSFSVAFLIALHRFSLRGSSALVVLDLTVRIAAESCVNMSTLHHSLTQNQHDFCYFTISLISVKITDLLTETSYASSIGDSHCRKGS